jgi:hypothetical protein
MKKEENTLAVAMPCQSDLGTAEGISFVGSVACTNWSGSILEAPGLDNVVVLNNNNCYQDQSV